MGERNFQLCPLLYNLHYIIYSWLMLLGEVDSTWDMQMKATSRSKMMQNTAIDYMYLDYVIKLSSVY